MSYDSAAAKAYRAKLGARPRQSSTPKAVEFGDRRLESFPVTHHTAKMPSSKNHTPYARGGFNLNSTRNISNTFQSGGKK